MTARAAILKTDVIFDVGDTAHGVLGVGDAAHGECACAFPDVSGLLAFLLNGNLLLRFP